MAKLIDEMMKQIEKELAGADGVNEIKFTREGRNSPWEMSWRLETAHWVHGVNQLKNKKDQLELEEKHFDTPEGVALVRKKRQRMESKLFDEYIARRDANNG